MCSQSICVYLKTPDGQAYSLKNLDDVTHSIVARDVEKGKQITHFFTLKKGRTNIPVDKFMEAETYTLLSLNIPISGPIDGSYGKYKALDRFKVIRVPTSILLHGGAITFKTFDAMNLHVCFGHEIGPHNTVHGDKDMERAWDEIGRISKDKQQKLFELLVTDSQMPTTQKEVDNMLKRDPSLQEPLARFFKLAEMNVYIGDKSANQNVVSLPCNTLFEIDELARTLHVNNRITLNSTFLLTMVGTEIYNAYLNKQGGLSNESFDEWLQTNRPLVKQRLRNVCALNNNSTYMFDKALDPNKVQICSSQTGNELTFGNTENADCQKSLGGPTKDQLEQAKFVAMEMIKDGGILKCDKTSKCFQPGAECMQVSQSELQTNAEVDYDKVGSILRIVRKKAGDCEDSSNFMLRQCTEMKVYASASTESIQTNIDTLRKCGNEYPTCNFKFSGCGRDFPGYGNKPAKQVNQSSEVITPEYLRFLAAAWPKLNATVGAASGAHLTQETPTTQTNVHYTDTTAYNIKQSTERLVNGLKSKELGGHAYPMELPEDPHRFVVCGPNGVEAEVLIFENKNEITTFEGTATKIPVAIESDVKHLEAQVQMNLSLSVPKTQTNEEIQKCQQIGLKLEKMNQLHKCVMRQDAINILSNIMTEVVQGNSIITSTPKGNAESFYKGDLCGIEGHFIMMMREGLDKMKRNASFNRDTKNNYAISKQKFQGIFNQYGTIGCFRPDLKSNVLCGTIKATPRYVGEEYTNKQNATKLIAGCWSSLAATDEEIDEAQETILGLLERKCEEIGVGIELPKGPNAQFTNVITEKRMGIVSKNEVLFRGNAHENEIRLGDIMVLRDSLKTMDPKQYKSLHMTAFTHLVSKTH